MRILYFILFPMVLFAQIREGVGGIPVSREEVISFTDHALATFEEQMIAFKSIPADMRTFDNTVGAWNLMLEELWTKVVTLGVLSLATSDGEALFKAQREALVLMAKMQGACRDKEALEIIEEFANSDAAKGCSLSEAYQISTLLQTAGKEWTREGMLPYTPLKGEKKVSEKGEFTVLNWNVCFFPGSLSLLFGGVLPWQERIEGVSNQIIESGADIVCLQEVFSREAAKILYLALRKEYSYFYINIGLKPFGFNPDLIGLSSGLFVASKVEIEDPQFIPFQKTPPVRGYGFFSMNIPKIGNLITTHLNPGSDPIDLVYRAEQVKEIVHFIQQENRETPAFLCGDLNIEKKSSEYKEILEPQFIDCYTGSYWTCLELRDYWWQAAQNVDRFKALGFSYESIDYFLSFKGGGNGWNVVTDLILVNNPDRPREALSDHQAMISTFKQ